MTDVLDAFKNRRSIRKYLTKEVPQKLIADVLAVAGWAPSAHNAQPWRFIVLDNASVKRKLADAMAEAWAADLAKDGAAVEDEKRKEKAERFANAPVLILACLTMEGMHNFADEKRQQCERDLAMQSLGAALENLLLAAYAKGLGACWFSAPAFCKERVRSVLKIPAEVEPEALVVIGYPAETPKVPNKKPLAEYCFLDGWGGKL
jgi:coenzyme F420-0:L-glutamate ligase / coenzyme F420-1:gamma-L-glutamate ligase